MEAVKRNNVKIFGQGETPMLFAHGYGCDQNMWRYITPAFEKDYKIILFDHVGFGQSDASDYNPSRYNSLRSYAADIVAICEELRLKDVVFVGHSVSATIGVLAYLQAPSFFSKLILIAPSPRYINDGEYIGGFSQESMNDLLNTLDSDYLGWAHAIAPVIMGNPAVPALAEELAGSFCSSNIDVAKDFARITFLSDNRADLPNVKIEALILQCSEDAIAPLTVGEYMQEHMPQSTLVLLEATGHCPNLSAPEETIAAMKTFLEDHP